MKRIIITLLLVLSFTSTSFAAMADMNGKVSGVMHCDIIPQGDDRCLVHVFYDDYVNFDRIKVNGCIDMVFMFLEDSWSITMLEPYWNNDFVVGVLSVIVSVPGTDSQIYHLEAIDTSGAYNPANFTIYWNSGMINKIGSYGYWDVSCRWHGEQIANDVILANDRLFFDLLF